MAHRSPTSKPNGNGGVGSGRGQLTLGQRGGRRCRRCDGTPLINGVELQLAPHTAVSPAGRHGAAGVARDDWLVGRGAAAATGIGGVLAVHEGIVPVSAVIPSSAGALAECLKMESHLQTSGVWHPDGAIACFALRTEWTRERPFSVDNPTEYGHLQLKLPSLQRAGFQYCPWHGTNTTCKFIFWPNTVHFACQPSSALRTTLSRSPQNRWRVFFALRANR